MTLDDLRREYESQGIGRLLYGIVAGVARSVSHSYDPQVYARAARWEDGLEDLLHDVVEALLDEGQIDYIMLHAVDEDHVRRLLARQVRRVLARRRTRTVVDNLLDRCKRIVASEPFRRIDHNGTWSFSLACQEADSRVPNAEDLKAVARDLAALPRVTPGPSERSPIVYAEETLRVLLRVVSEKLATVVSVGDLDAIFKFLLTSWVPTLLGIDEGAYGLERPAQLAPDDMLIAADTATRILLALDPARRLLLRLKLAGISDSEVAHEFGISRPTAADRKKGVLDLIAREIGEMPEILQQAVVDDLSRRLYEGEGGL